MPPTLERVKKFLSRSLTPNVADKVNFTLWLHNLFADDFGAVLAVNLYTDLRNRSVTILSITNVLNRLLASPNYNGAAREGFYLCIEGECQDLCLCQHPAKALPLEDDDRYVRVLPLQSMIDHYFRDALDLPPGAEAEAEVRAKFYGSAPRKGLGIVKKTWKGKMNNVWVSSLKVLLDTLAAMPEPEEGEKDKKPDVLRDRLGFIGCDNGTLVYVAYPPNFVEASVPTTLDAHSGCYFFVPSSQPPATWGLTCSLKAEYEGLWERVHMAFEGLTDEFESEIIGDISERGVPDRKHLLDVALSRASGGVSRSGNHL